MSAATTLPTEPRIYVACLASYNNGVLHGRWIDAAQYPGDIEDEIAAMLAESSEPSAEEWAIHDYDNFGGIRLGESESMMDVATLAGLVVQYGAVFAALVNHIGTNHEESARMMTENYQGLWDSPAAWAKEQLKDSGQLAEVPPMLRGYVDFEAYARDCELGGDILSFDVGNQVAVFWNH